MIPQNRERIDELEEAPGREQRPSARVMQVSCCRTRRLSRRRLRERLARCSDEQLRRSLTHQSRAASGRLLFDAREEFRDILYVRPAGGFAFYNPSLIKLYRGGHCSPLQRWFAQSSDYGDPVRFIGTLPFAPWEL
jgi:hypothetical protein